MAEENIQQQQPEATQPEPVAQPEPDLITRVSQVKPAEKVPEAPVESSGGDAFNINDLDAQIGAIQDPAVREQMLGLKKSLLRGENQKYQEIAKLRKEYESRLSEMSTWSPDRLKQELNKPDFVQAAQEVLKGNNPQQSAEERWSALSDEERAELRQLQQKMMTLERANYESVKTSQDARLKSKYANYAPELVDTTITNLMNNKMQATREDIWKVLDYENAVKRAYELGLQDKKTQDVERAVGMSVIDGRNIPAPSSLSPEQGESTEKFMRRAYAHHSKKK